MSDRTMARGHRLRCRQAADAGFTLLEIMVALLVLSMIVTSAFGTLRLGQRSWQAGVTKAAATEDQRTVKELLRRQFNQILPLSRPLDGKERLAFEGDARQVRFIAPAPRQHGAGGLLEFTLNGQRYSGLTLSYRLLDPAAEGWGPESEAQQITLVDGLRKATLRYYGATVKDQPPRWHRQWRDDAEEFPQLVQLQLTSRDDAPPWPDLYLTLPARLAQ